MHKLRYIHVFCISTVRGCIRLGDGFRHIRCESGVEVIIHTRAAWTCSMSSRLVWTSFLLRAWGHYVSRLNLSHSHFNLREGTFVVQSSVFISPIFLPGLETHTIGALQQFLAFCYYMSVQADMIHPGCEKGVFASIFLYILRSKAVQ